MIGIGETFKSLKPEVQSTLDKIFSQVELVSHTLNLLEKRLSFSEDRLFEMMTYIKDHDVSVRPRIVQGYPSFANGEDSSNIPYIVRPTQLDNMITGHDSESGNSSKGAPQIAECLRSAAGGEEYFRSTNVFASM